MDAVRDQFVARRAAPPRPASTCSSSTWRTATCCRSFLSPLTNRRARRVRRHAREPGALPARGLRRVPRRLARRAPDVGAHLGHRLVPGGFDGDEAVAFARCSRARGCDVVDVSTGQVWPERGRATGAAIQTPFADRIRHEVGIADDRRRRDLQLRRRQHDRARRPRRPLRARAAAPLRPVLDAARRGRAGLRRSRGCRSTARAAARRRPARPTRCARRRCAASTSSRRRARFPPAGGRRSPHEAALRLVGGRRDGDHHAHRRRAQEPAHVRLLRRAARHVPRARARARRQARS